MFLLDKMKLNDETRRVTMDLKSYAPDLKSFEGLSYEDALLFLQAFENNELDLEQFQKMAEQMRQENMGNTVDLCSIMNIKSGECSEDCRFCAQSAYYDAPADHFDLRSENDILQEAKNMETSGVDRFSLVSSGGYLDEEDLEKLVSIYKRIKEETSLKICASHGILKTGQAEKLRQAGVLRYHHNLESSREYYKDVCTTHDYEERIETVKDAMQAGMEVCSGGIFGLGETMKDRIDMAYEFKKLNVNSIPINVLNPIPGTPFEAIAPQSEKSLLFMTVLYRWIMPKTEIRFAGGRIKLGESAKKAFQSGVNGVLTGDFLTTTGTDIASDRKMFTDMGYELKRK